MFPPQSTPSKRPKRRVESYRIYKRPYSACSQSSRPSPSSYEKATHGRLVGPTLSTPRGDKYYNQYRPLCEVCPRDRGKVVGTLRGFKRLGPTPNLRCLYKGPFVLIAVSHLTAILKKTHFKDTLFACRVMLFVFLLSADFFEELTLSKNPLINNTISECQTSGQTFFQS